MFNSFLFIIWFKIRQAIGKSLKYARVDAQVLFKYLIYIKF